MVSQTVDLLAAAPGASPAGSVRVRVPGQGNWMNLRLFGSPDPGRFTALLRGGWRRRDITTAVGLSWTGFRRYAQPIRRCIATLEHPVDLGVRFYSDTVGERRWGVLVAGGDADEEAGSWTLRTEEGHRITARKRHLAEEAPVGVAERESLPEIDFWAWSGLAIGAGVVLTGLMEVARPLLCEGIEHSVGFELEFGCRQVHGPSPAPNPATSGTVILTLP